MHADKSTEQALREQHASIESEEVYRGKPFWVRRDTCHLDGKVKRWDIVVHPGAVVLLPVLKGGDLLLVKQWRRASGKILLELPAGTLEAGEAPAVCAERELREETGYRAGRMLPLGGFFTAPGFCTEYLHLFLALNLERAPLQTEDEDEHIDIVRASFEKVERMIEDSEIQDAKTIAGFYRYARWLQSQKI